MLEALQLSRAGGILDARQASAAPYFANRTLTKLYEVGDVAIYRFDTLRAVTDIIMKSGSVGQPAFNSQKSDDVTIPNSAMKLWPIIFSHWNATSDRHHGATFAELGTVTHTGHGALSERSSS